MFTNVFINSRLNFKDCLHGAIQVLLLCCGILSCCGSHHLLNVPWDCLVSKHPQDARGEIKIELSGSYHEPGGDKVMQNRPELAGAKMALTSKDLAGAKLALTSKDLAGATEALAASAKLAESSRGLSSQRIGVRARGSLELAGVSLVVYGLLQILSSLISLLLLALRSDVAKRLSVLEVCSLLVQFLSCLVAEITVMLLLYNTRNLTRRSNPHCSQDPSSTDLVSWPGALVGILLLALLLHVLAAAILVSAWSPWFTKVSSPPRVRLVSDRTDSPTTAAGGSGGPRNPPDLDQLVRSRALAPLWSLHAGQPASPALLSSFDSLAEVPLSPYTRPQL